MAKQGTDGLTDKQRIFRDELVGGATQVEAYKAAFDTSTMLETTISKRAGELAKLPKIAVTISGIVKGAQDLAARALSYTLHDAILEADRLIGMAEAEGQSGAAVSAATLKAKLAGHLVERKEVRSGPLEDADVQELQRVRRELARSKESEREALDLVGASPSPAAISQGSNRPTSSTVH